MAENNRRLRPRSNKSSLSGAGWCRSDREIDTNERGGDRDCCRRKVKGGWAGGAGRRDLTAAYELLTQLVQRSLLTSNFKSCVTTFLITPQRNDVSACMLNYFSPALAAGVIHRVSFGPFSSPTL